MANILLIDDDAALRTVMRKLLERWGHDVRDAPNGAVGLAMAREKEPHLVISDLIMPEQEGVETIIALRREFPVLKVLAVSGAGRDGDWQPLRDAELLGADSSLEKPFRAEELCSAVEGLLGLTVPEEDRRSA